MMMVAPLHPVAEANERSPFGDLTPEHFYDRHGITHSSSFMRNARGMNIFTQSWLPIDHDNKQVMGIVCLVHGYTGESSWFLQLTAVAIAKQGFACCALDHQGHGFSDGLSTHITNIEPVLDDCQAFFSNFCSRFPPSLPAFLYAESLGGAMALLLHLRDKRSWSGLILNGTMCGISPRFKPPWPLEHLLWIAAAVAPTWQVVPTRAIPHVSFKEEWKFRLALGSPRRTATRPRAGTALELLRICKVLQDRFEEVEAPMLVVHGEEDIVCDPKGVEELVRRAGSKDKTLKIYEGMWHQLVGEPQENVEKVFGDIINWLKDRATRARAHADAQ
ncbi:hypothetical protein AMTRI_Chr07g74680 [Amborella trichopoda]